MMAARQGAAGTPEEDEVQGKYPTKAKIRERPILHVSEVTPGWLSARLGTSIARFEASRIGVGQGFLGSLHRLDLTIDRAPGPGDRGDDVGDSILMDAGRPVPITAGARPSTIIAKLAPLEMEASEMFQQFFKPMGVFAREAAFYREVSPLIERFSAQCMLADSIDDEAEDEEDEEWSCTIPSSSVSSGSHSILPRCYGVELDEESGCGIILLEDLRARGDRMEQTAEDDDARQSLTLPRLQLALRAVAALHALFFTLPGHEETLSEGAVKSPPFPFLLTGDEPIFTELISTFYAQSLEKFRCMFGDLLPDEIWARCAAITPAISTRTRQRSALAVCHGDLWRANLMYSRAHDGSEEVALIDWQFVSWGNPLSDVALLIYSSIDAELRRTHEEALLRFYHSQLMKFLRRRQRSQRSPCSCIPSPDHYTFDQCCNDYREVLRDTFVQTISSFEAFLDPDQDAPEGDPGARTPPLPGPAVVRLIEMTKDLAADRVL